MIYRCISFLWCMTLLFVDTLECFVPKFQVIYPKFKMVTDVNDTPDLTRFPKGDSAAVEDKDEHLRLLDRSLKKHSGLSIYDRIFGENVDNFSSADVHSNTRFVVISHDTADSTPASVLRNEGPVFNYGNKAALLQFKMKWDELTKLPSRYSAEQMEQEARDNLLREVTENGFVVANDNIPRVAKGGHRFYIHEYTVWNIYDDDGCYYGQACIFDREHCTPES